MLSVTGERSCAGYTSAMSEWDFTYGLTGQELEDAQSSGATAEEWAFIEAQDQRKNRVHKSPDGTLPQGNRGCGKEKKKSK